MTKTKKEQLLEGRTAIEKRSQQLDRDIVDLFHEMFKNPEEALQNSVTASREVGNVEGAIDKLENDVFSIGKPVGGRVGKAAVAKRIKFNEIRKEAVKLIRQIPYVHKDLETVNKYLAEIEGHRTKEKDQPSYDVEREANNTSISDEKVKELKAQEQAKIMQELKEIREQKELERDDELER